MSLPSIEAFTAGKRFNASTAAFTKNKIAIGKGNHYDIQMDDDANLVIVLCLVLTIDCSENSDNSPGVNVDLGNIGPEEKPFDRSWEPS